MGGRGKPRWCCSHSRWAPGLLVRTRSCWPPLVCAYWLSLAPVLSHPPPLLPLPLLLPLVLVLVLLPLGLRVWPMSGYVFTFAAGPAVARPRSFYSPWFVFPRPRSHLPLPPAFVCVSSGSSSWCCGCLPAFVRGCSSYRAATAVVPAVCCLSPSSLHVCSSPLVRVPAHSFVCSSVFIRGLFVLACLCWSPLPGLLSLSFVCKKYKVSKYIIIK